jgi:hypothetical protein
MRADVSGSSKQLSQEELAFDAEIDRTYVSQTNAR